MKVIHEGANRVANGTDTPILVEQIYINLNHMFMLKQERRTTTNGHTTYTESIVVMYRDNRWSWPWLSRQ